MGIDCSMQLETTWRLVHSQNEAKIVFSVLIQLLFHFL